MTSHRCYTAIALVLALGTAGVHADGLLNANFEQGLTHWEPAGNVALTGTTNRLVRLSEPARDQQQSSGSRSRLRQVFVVQEGTQASVPVTFRYRMVSAPGTRRPGSLPDGFMAFLLSPTGEFLWQQLPQSTVPMDVPSKAFFYTDSDRVSRQDRPLIAPYGATITEPDAEGFRMVTLVVSADLATHILH